MSQSGRPSVIRRAAEAPPLPPGGRILGAAPQTPATVKVEEVTLPVCDYEFSTRVNAGGEVHPVLNWKVPVGLMPISGQMCMGERWISVPFGLPHLDEFIEKISRFRDGLKAAQEESPETEGDVAAAPEGGQDAPVGAPSARITEIAREVEEAGGDEDDYRRRLEEEGLADE